MGGVETDELYVGVDRHGVHYVLPVQASGANRTGYRGVCREIPIARMSANCRPIHAR